MRRRLPLMCMLVMVPTVVARADILILEDGTERRGQAERKDDAYTLVTPEGETLKFTKAEVKRYIFESRITPTEAAAMFKEFYDLVRPALETPEPQQYVWLRDITEHASSFYYSERSGRVGYTQRRHVDIGQYDLRDQGSAEVGGVDGGQRVTGGIESQTLRDKRVDTVFIDDWARYIASFERLADDLRFQELIQRGQRRHSLREFATWPPEGYEYEAEALKRALDRVEACIDTADNTNRLVGMLPTRQRNLRDDINRAQDRVDRARVRLHDAPNNRKDNELRKLRDAEDTLRRRITRMNREIPKLSRTAERHINEFARLREVTRGSLARAAQRMGAIHASDAPAEISVPDAVNLSELIDLARQRVAAHRAQAAGLTPLAVEQCRADAEEDLRELFEGRLLSMGLYIKTNGRTDDGGYALRAEDRAAGQGVPRTVAQLRFGEAFFEELGMCAVDAEIALTASVADVRLVPALAELERSSVEPRFEIRGTVQAVETGCE